MQITLSTTFNTKFATVANWEQANTAARAIWKKDKYSDIAYRITFDDGEQASGSIDIEPKSHFAPVNRNIITWHLKTFWTNLANYNKSFPAITQEDKDYFKNLLTRLP